MDKDEILSRSRKENKDKDLFKIEVQIQAGHIGSLTATLLATFFFVTQVWVGEGFDFGLYAIIISISAAGSIYKAMRVKYKRDLVLASVYTLATLILAVTHIIQITTGKAG